MSDFQWIERYNEHRALFDSFRAEVEQEHDLDAQRGCICTYPDTWLVNAGTDAVKFEVRDIPHRDCPLHGAS